jgi:hypothetical protein
VLFRIPDDGKKKCSNPERFCSFQQLIRNLESQDWRDPIPVCV